MNLVHLLNSSRLLTICALGLVSIVFVSPLLAQRGQASPAAQRPPQTTTPQQYPREQVEAGRVRFGAQCGFCHGRDAAGGEGGTDLTRSALVAGDVRGNSIIPLVRSGRTPEELALVFPRTLGMDLVNPAPAKTD